jgi:cytochrome c oxidase cbb3-type subunit III
MTKRKDFGAFGHKVFRASSALACISVVLLTVALGSQEKKQAGTPVSAQRSAESIADGRQFFENRCAGCHGIDGRGGERAPDIATDQKVQRRTDSALTQIIHNGIPSGGMPASSTLDAATTRSLVRYLRFLQGKTGSAALPGNPHNGKQLFFGKARCSACHLAAGEGGFIAADLSSYGGTRPVEEIRDAILKPGRDRNPQQGTVSVTTHDGQKVTGVVRNEDNFSLQLQSLDGAFHLIMKSDVASLTRDSTSLMPADYGSALSADELNDLISFLMSVAQKDKSDPHPNTKSEGSDEDE